MDIVADQKQISQQEKNQINKQVKTELLDHLYQGCLPGTVSGIIVTVALFLDYYGYTPTYLLIAWILFFLFMMFSLTSLYFFYVNYKRLLNSNTWELLYSIMMVGCAVSWVPGIYLLPHDLTRQYLALLAFFMASTGYATGTIGQFSLCVITLNIMLVPLTLWCLSKGGLFYDIIATYSIIYMGFMLAINHRSTRWFKESLKLKLENTLVSYQANHDLLTNLPNQRLLPQYMAAAINFVKDKHSTFVVVCFSLNRMEIINDSYGHQAGDSIIQAVAERLNSLATQGGRQKTETQYIITISRKDTFNILVAPLKLEDIESKIKLLFSVVDDPFYLEQKGIKLSASIGVSIYPKDGKDMQSLLTSADAAMLRAKQFGGNRIEFYETEINALMPQQIEMEHDLYNVLKNNELFLNYQPLVNIKTGQLAGMEALLRWKHPVHGIISPAKFIPIAEETGLIVPIGEWVLQEACRQTLIWHQMGFKSLKVAVNLAEKQLRQRSIVETIARIIDQTGFNPLFLELEITETAMLGESVMPLIKEFKQMGMSLAVDDFGTGYSGLSYLKRFSIDKLKIDQSFIRDIPENNDSITIVSAILAMAKELKVHTLAEGVETLEQLQFLKMKNCEYAQGYYFSKPLDASDFTRLLLNQRTLVHEE